MSPMSPSTASTGLPQQLAMLLRRRITSGAWPVGERLPNLNELAAEFEVSRVTMQQALTELANEGLILRRRGQGTIVTAAPVDQRWFTLAADFQGLTARDGSHARLVESYPSKRLPAVKPDEGCLAERYQYLRHVHWRGTVLSAVTDIHLATDVYELAGGERAFEAREVMNVLAELDGLFLSEARQTLTIGAADMEIAKLLEVPLNTPLAEVRRLMLDDKNRVVYNGHLAFRGDLVRLDFTLRNDAKRRNRRRK